MKTVKLTQEEIDVILENLDVYHICYSRCYCNYKADGMCDRKGKDGKPMCRLKKTIASIEQKLGE